MTDPDEDVDDEDVEIIDGSDGDEDDEADGTPTAGYDDAGVAVRDARGDDRDAVLAFASDTWEGWDYLPEVWRGWLDGDGDLLVAADLESDEPVGVCHLTTYLTGEAWLEGLRVHPDRRRDGVATALLDAALDRARRDGAVTARCMTFDWNEPGVAFLDDATDFERVASLRHGRGFGFPYGSKLEDATFDASLDALRDTDAYEATDGLYATPDWELLQLPDSVANFREGVEVLGWEQDDEIRAILVCTGTRTNTTGEEDRSELVFGFVWVEHQYASQLALDVRGEARERNVQDALVFLPDEEDVVAAFEQAGFDLDGEDLVYERTL